MDWDFGGSAQNVVNHENARSELLLNAYVKSVGMDFYKNISKNTENKLSTYCTRKTDGKDHYFFVSRSRDWSLLKDLGKVSRFFISMTSNR